MKGAWRAAMKAHSYPDAPPPRPLRLQGARGSPGKCPPLNALKCGEVMVVNEWRAGDVWGRGFVREREGPTSCDVGRHEQQTY